MDDVAVGESDAWEMTNLYPRHTGLPMTVWVSPRGRARHAPRIKVCIHHGDRMVADETAVVSVWLPVTLIAGDLSRADLNAVKAWVQLNEVALRDFWLDGDVARLLQRLLKITASQGDSR